MSEHDVQPGVSMPADWDKRVALARSEDLTAPVPINPETGKPYSMKVGRSGLPPPIATRWKKGESPRMNGGTRIIEAMNSLISRGVTEDQLRRMAKSKGRGPAWRAAAVQVLRMMEQGDLADFQAVLDGTKTLEQLRDEDGVDTTIVKKIKPVSPTEHGGGGNEIELHDRTQKALELVIGHTHGKPAERQEITVKMPQVVEIITPMTRRGEMIDVESKPALPEGEAR